MRLCGTGNYADGRLPVLLRMPPLQATATPEAGRLLRVLFVRFNELPAHTAAAQLLQIGVVSGAAITRLPACPFRKFVAVHRCIRIGGLRSERQVKAPVCR
jgi:hypothetical protein